MYELVHSTFHSKLFSALRLSSFAGNGLPERMRSISFALLGLTAAAGLALVAIFAQPSFSLLSPAPLPDEPSVSESIGAAKKLLPEHIAVAVMPARPVHAQRGVTGPGVEATSESRSGSTGSHDQGEVAPTEVDAPTPVSTPEPSGGGNSGGGTGNETGGGPDPAPTAAQEQPAASPSAPASSPQPASPKPEAIASAPKPAPAPAPGNSSSSAAAEHASERGIEASAGSGPPAATPTTASSSESESPSPPGNGNGLAKGHYK